MKIQTQFLFISYFIAEEEAWISEKQQLLTVPDLGDNMAAVQGLIKKHDAFEGDISVHGERYVKYWFSLTKENDMKQHFIGKMSFQMR